MMLLHQIFHSGQKRLIFSLSVKIFASFVFFYVYTFFYTDKQSSDVYKYFHDAQNIFENIGSIGQFLRILFGLQNESDHLVLSHTHFWYTDENITILNDGRSLIRFNLLLLPLSGGKIVWHFLVITLLSFSGMWGAFQGMRIRGSSLWIAYFMSFFLPSVLFWSSGVIKEGLLVFVLGWFLYLLFSFSERPSFLRAAGIMLCLWLVLLIKFYVFPALCLFLIIFSSLEQYRMRKLSFINSAGVILSAIGLMFLSGVFLFPDLPKSISDKQKAFINLGRGGHYLKNLANGDTLYIPPDFKLIQNNAMLKVPEQAKVFHWKNLSLGQQLSALEINKDSLVLILSLKKSGSYFPVDPIKPDWTGLVWAAPKALFNATFRPFPRNLNSIPEYFSFFELCLMGVFLIVRLALGKRFQCPDHSFLFSSILFAGFILCISGLTTPVSGALVRYRMPAFWFLSLSIFAQNKKADLERPASSIDI